ncbi:MAG: EAL domain-containing protein [Aquificaceae bacterium]
MIILYCKDSGEAIKQTISLLNIPFKTIGDVFLLNVEVEQFLNLLEHFPQDVLRKLRLYVYNEETPEIKVEKLIEAGFNSISIDELLEDHMFKNLSQILGGGKIYFHAIIDVKRKKLYGFEALCRLSIPIYKLFKVSNRIALLVDNYCRELALLEFSKFHSYYPYSIFLNFHPKFLKEPLENVGSFIANLMNKGIDPSEIVVEIDEYEGMELKSLKLIRDFLKAERIRVALDDVGAGYSGLYQLTEIHPDIAKIDMALVRDIHKHIVKQSVLKGLVEACKSAGIKVLVEGVEKREELEFILNLDVDLIQGFIFGKPDPYPNVKEIEKLAYDLLS